MALEVAHIYLNSGVRVAEVGGPIIMYRVEYNIHGRGVAFVLLGKLGRI